METPESIVEEALVDEDPLNDPYTRALLNNILETDRLAAFEIALMEIALFDLHIHRDEIEEVLTTASEKDVTKLHRAVAKTFYRMRENGTHLDISVIEKYLKSEVSKAKYITIAEYERRDGTVIPEHKRKLPEDMTRRSLEELSDIAREVKRSSEEPSENWLRTMLPSDREKRDKRLESSKKVLAEAPAYMREMAQQKQVVVDQERAEVKEKKSLERAKTFQTIEGYYNDGDFQAAGKNILKQETSWGERWGAAVDYFLAKTTDKTATIRFGARAIKDYGPIAGMRMVNAYMRYGGYDVPLREKDGYVVTEMGDVLPDPVSAENSREWALNALRSRLPSQRTYDAQSTPPSEGFVIDGEGNILVHAVGRGKDHFLPFNTQHLKKIKNTDRVEFVRSRMVGGPTQEDLHAAMMMGADKLTVISNSGTFTLDFTKRSHGIKLEHFQVLTRYQEILDEYEASSFTGKKKGLLDADGYTRALQSISDEFPLHINYNSMSNTPGMWDKYHDYVQPKSRMLDQLRSLFGIDTKDAQGRVIDPRSRHAAFSQGGQRYVSELTQGRNWREAFMDARADAVAEGKDDVQANVMWLKRVYDDYQRAGKTLPMGLKQELDTWLKASAQRSGVQQSPQSNQAIQQVKERLSVAEELENNPLGHVAVRSVDPAPAASRPLTDDQKKWVQSMSNSNSRAMSLLDAEGFSVGTATDRGRAKSLLDDVTFQIEAFERKGEDWDGRDILDRLGIDDFVENFQRRS